MNTVQLCDLRDDAIDHDSGAVRGGIAVRHMDPVLGIDTHVAKAQLRQ